MAQRTIGRVALAYDSFGLLAADDHLFPAGVVSHQQNTQEQEHDYATSEQCGLAGNRGVNAGNGQPGSLPPTKR